MAKQRKPFVSRKRRREMEEARARRESIAQAQEDERLAQEAAPITQKRVAVSLPTSSTVGEFAVTLNVPVTRVMSQLIKNGVMAAVNDRIDFDTMSLIADDLGFTAQTVSSDNDDQPAAPTPTAPLEAKGGTRRPPIVTLMGHVDHGKTSLLDAIRQSSVAQSEHGGITQHIGAYQIEHPFEGERRLITFLDTPGHEAFTALRSHGASVTDIVILVVAADDGVKPQTIEAINHAKNARVAIIVAVNKIDLPGASADRVMQQLTEHELVPEQWGGATIVAPVSAKTGEGIQQLLEYILLTADLKDLRADPQRPAQGVVIESRQAPGLGAVATVLVQTGTLKRGDVVVIGTTWGKIRSMTDYSGRGISQAPPSTPAQISGLTRVPTFGESFTTVSSEKEAKSLTERVTEQTKRSGIEQISQAIAEGRANALPIVLKADAHGSLEAIKHAIAGLTIPGAKAHVVHSSIGEITLSDVQLAQAAGGIVIGFGVSANPSVVKAAQLHDVTVLTFTIIYDLIEHIRLALEGRVKVTSVRVEKGRLTVKKVFRTTRAASIIGGEITKGVMQKGLIAEIRRLDEVIGHGAIESVQKGPESVVSLEAGQDCGLQIATTSKIDVGDTIVALQEETVVAETLDH